MDLQVKVLRRVQKRMNLEELSNEQILTFEIYAEQVSRSAKYMADIGIWQEENSQGVLDELFYLASKHGLRLFLQEYEDSDTQYVAVYLYKYSWVEDLMIYLTTHFVENPGTEAAFHIICGLVYGYGPVEIEEFLSKQSSVSKGRQMAKGAVEKEPKE